jgi:YjbE family integral membrane protein
MEFDLSSAVFWVAVGQIILIDILLSGDNAVVIALACRNLSPELRRTGIFWGVAGAVSLRVLLTVFAALVMNLPWLKFAGGLLLVWIAVKLMLPEGDEGCDIEPSVYLWGAIKTIVVADFVMSLDNVIGVAGAAHGNVVLLLFGLAVSIPLIVGSSQIILHWMERFPAIVLLGVALLGFVAGEMMLTDAGVLALLPPLPAWSARAAGVVGALLVVFVGRWFERRILARQDVTIV